ncbi:MAG TPA: Uma2 family endonuclease [Allocoleopsis sp.]
MTTTQPIPSQPIEHSPAEKRVTLHVNWNAYEAILEALGEQRSARLTYYKGLLEIMTPLEPHEHSKKLLGQFIEILVEELNWNLKSMGSTRLKRSELETGAEPDEGYYIANEAKVRGKIVDLKTDPPPDLVVEVDITHTDIDKNQLYAELGIPELWRYDGSTLKIYQLQNKPYQETEGSLSFPDLPKERFYEFINECAQQGEIPAKRNLRVWIREQLC